MVQITSFLPEVYKTFLPDFFQSDIPEETLATCDKCAMCDQSEGYTSNVDLFYNKMTKCCTYHPTIPNYLIGGVLNSQDNFMEIGRKNIAEIVRRKIGVYPAGIQPSEKYKLLFKASRKKLFGVSEALLCPLYGSQNGNCSIWQFRSGGCLTFFCKTVKGKDGRKFWKAMNDYLILVERNLSSYAMSSLGFDGLYILSKNENHGLSQEELDGRVDDSSCKKRWRQWVGNEAEFYKRSFHIVQNIDRSVFKDIMGIQGALYLEQLTGLRETMLSPSLPFVLRRNPLLSTRKINNGYLLTNDYGNFRVSKKLYDIIDFFDGSLALDEIKQQLQRDSSCGISDKLITKLFQNEILI